MSNLFALALDGVYVRDEEGELQFRELGEPTTEDVAQVAAWTHASLLRVLNRHGRSLDGVSDAADSFATDQPVLASCYGAPVADVQLLGPAAGRKTAKLVRPLHLMQSTRTTALAEVGGVNIHAAVAVDGRDRKRLERCVHWNRVPLHRAPSALARAPRSASRRPRTNTFQERVERRDALRVARPARLHQSPAFL